MTIAIVPDSSATNLTLSNRDVDHDISFPQTESHLENVDRVHSNVMSAYAYALHTAATVMHIYHHVGWTPSLYKTYHYIGLPACKDLLLLRLERAHCKLF